MLIYEAVVSKAILLAFFGLACSMPFAVRETTASEDLLAESIERLERSKTSDAAFVTTRRLWVAADDGELQEFLTSEGSFDGYYFWQTHIMNGERGVFAWNEDYQFSMSSTDRPGEWILKDTQISADSPDRRMMQARMDEMFRDPHLRIGDPLLADVLSRNKERTIVDHISVDGQKAIRFEIKPNSDEKAGRFPKGIDRIEAVITSSDPCYVISYHVEDSDHAVDGRFSEVEFDPSGGFRRCMLNETMNMFREDFPDQRLRFEFESRLGVAHADAKYRLRDYGLPEPPAARAPGSYRTPMWIYYFIGGVLLTAGGAMAVYFGTKRGVRA